jgi:hypothetical protein
VDISKLLIKAFQPLYAIWAIAEKENDAIVKYAKGHGTFAGAPFINHQSLSEKGFIAEELKN